MNMYKQNTYGISNGLEAVFVVAVNVFWGEDIFFYVFGRGGDSRSKENFTSLNRTFKL